MFDKIELNKRIQNVMLCNLLFYKLSQRIKSELTLDADWSKQHDNGYLFNKSKSHDINVQIMDIAPVPIDHVANPPIWI